MSQILNFQDAILRLSAYWAEAGCLLWQPYNTEVGAGTMNPATFLRVLGPEPWNVGYVEPSVRPDDSRYGENPNRIQMHTQYQVILKPDPGNPQEIYLKSLEALGIDGAKHDIRFVEDNWNSPALGAWGLGWEVWLDGLEITQFTYFQQAGGFTLEPPSVEITYGLERILMALQGVDHFKKIQYSPALSYGELFGQNEYEMSVYNLDQAEVERARQLFDLYEAEALMLLGKGLPIPAYYYVLKTSHAFNILDSRGAIGVTERARSFARMRDLSRKVAAAWLDRRKELGFPLGAAAPVEAPPLPAPPQPSDQPQTFLLEIGSEELPAADVDLAIEQLRNRVPSFFRELRLDHGEIQIDATPRRLAIIVNDLAARQRDEERVVKGPPARVAFDANGQPTKAAIGFAAKQGVDLSALTRRATDGGDYVVAIIREEGKPAGEVLAETLPGLIAALSFPLNMRWNSTNVAYSRPVRWLVALLGGQIVPFQYAGLSSGRISRGLRNAAQPEFEIPAANDYTRLLAEHGIMLPVEKRRAAIWERAQELAAECGGRVPDSAHGDLLNEVANLVEFPTVLRGAFDKEYLGLPREALVTVMRKHQRYFPVEDDGGGLLPFFIAAANGPIDVDAVRAGNEAVLRARYADAAFFWKHDVARPLDSFRSKLAGLTFQEKLGSMLDKSQRVERLAENLAESLRMTSEERSIAQRAAFLAKADLMTQMVVELTSLAGIMGREYALRGGEPPEVAQAIFECALPRFAGDSLPSSKAGVVLSLADRLDSLIGLFAVGLAPTGAADPFALRRAALGVVQTLNERDVDLDLRPAIHAAAALQPVSVSPEVEQDTLDFIVRRMEQWWLERGERHDLVQAVLSARGNNPALAARALRDLAAAAKTGQLDPTVTAYSRPARIVRGLTIPHEIDPGRFELDQERTLLKAYEDARAKVTPDMAVSDFFDAFQSLIEPINKYFDAVFVMVEDQAVRDNRLALLKRIASLSEGIVDFTKVQGF